MKHIIAGTAGHIDHGKTTLVRALTGIDTDRLEEEKRRGISIDLGFAHLDLTPELRVGFVDVPGHERFVKNMLAGVAGIDLLLFVVAADESIKPQTREHFQIARLLQIPRGLVVLTKADAVDPELVELARLEIEEYVQGSFLEGAPIVAVSAITGQGLDDLRAAMIAQARLVPPRETQQYLRLPLDRSFSLHGFGTVVTGTLVSGAVSTEDEVEVQPGSRRLRVRSVQVHGAQLKKAVAGQRTALNVAGVEAKDLRRGQVLTAPGRYSPTTLLDCSLELLPSAKPLRDRSPVHFHAGTAEVVAEVRLLEAGTPLEPGKTALCRLRLREPLLLLPQDRFIIRLFSPVITIGGGVVLDARPERGRHALALTRLRAMAAGDLAARLAYLVREAPFGLGMPALVERLGVREEAITAAAGTLTVLNGPPRWFVDRARLAELAAALQTMLREFHGQHPLLPGLSKEELRTRLLPRAPSFVLEALLAQSKTVVAEGEVLRLTTHRLALQQEEEEAVRRMEALFQQAGLAVPAVGEVLAQAGVDATRGRDLLQLLLRQQRLVKISDELIFHQAALATLRTELQSQRGRRFTVPDFKEWTGVSRKYAIPLLEFLDRQRITRREGDARVVN